MERDYSEVWLSMRAKLRLLDEAVLTKKYKSAEILAELIEKEAESLRVAVKREASQKSYLQ